MKWILVILVVLAFMVGVDKPNTGGEMIYAGPSCEASNGDNISDKGTHGVPEPSLLLLLGIGVGAAAIYNKVKKRK